MMNIVLQSNYALYSNNKEYIFEVWNEEDNEVTQKDMNYFYKGLINFR